jgi:hypothetical protein
MGENPCPVKPDAAISSGRLRDKQGERQAYLDIEPQRWAGQHAAAMILKLHYEQKVERCGVDFGKPKCRNASFGVTTQVQYVEAL